MLYVEKDLSSVTKAIFDHWDSRKEELNHQYLCVANARLSPRDILACINKGIIFLSLFALTLLSGFSHGQSLHLHGSTDEWCT
jgi:hypothetical protein